jgi:hypothetical protein
LKLLLIPNKTVLRKVGIRTSEPDSVNLRARFEWTLAAIDLRPSSLPPSAILCVREVRDRSGRLRLGTHPDFAAVERWRQTIVSMLDDLAKRAARPAHESVPAGTEAVLFADHAELLACLALDWCCGSLTEHWWWTGLFPNESRPSFWTAIWRQHPEFIPAAAHTLAERRELPIVARSVGSGDAGLLLTAVLQQFALRELALALAQTHAGSFSTITRPSTKEIRPLTDIHTLPLQTAVAQISAQAPLPNPPPWRPWIPETELPSDLGGQEQCLFGIAVVLQRAPRLARSAPFAEAILNWIRVPHPSSRSPIPPAVITSKDQAVSTQIAPEGPLREACPEASTACSYGTSREQKQGFSETEVTVTPNSESTSPVGFCEQAGPAENSNAQPEADLSLSLVQPDASLPTHSPRDSAKPLTLISTPLLPQPWLAESKIETNFGGVFYLINAALQLGLYGDFTTPLHRGLALDIWDFLALTGYELAGVQLTADPLWPLLAQLAGRNQDDEDPGSGFEPPDCWQLSPDWLQPFADSSVWQWNFDTERLRVAHPEGFAIVDIPATLEDAGAQIRAALEAYAPPLALEMLPFRGRNGRVAPLHRWLGWLCDYLRARLARALGFPPRSAEALKVLLNEPARIVTTATQVSVFFSLAQHPLQIRLAGLDRDPGWVPAAGKNVLFFYD